MKLNIYAPTPKRSGCAKKWDWLRSRAGRLIDEPIPQRLRELLAALRDWTLRLSGNTNS